MLIADKFSHYLRYAIGEILLVTIGILIALSINNSNGTRKNEKRTKEILMTILQDIDSDLVEHKEIIEGFNKRLPEFRSYIRGEMSPEKMLEDKNYFFLFGYPEWSIEERTARCFEEMSYGDVVDICDSDEIRESSFCLWTAFKYEVIPNYNNFMQELDVLRPMIEQRIQGF